ncbi:endophilin-B1-like [Dysidea avara]|uniref:endophilin-B1-like n=1 Tax=Dysidea avara TaxID=196820 RepID=UPI00331C497E
MASGESNVDGSVGGTSSAKEKLATFRKFASVSYTRARQYASERLGKAELTEYDAELEKLLEQCDKIKTSTERILNWVELILQPNPGVRLEDKLYSTFHRGQQSEQQKQPRIRKSPFEYLGAEFLYSGNSFGAETQYGSYMVRCGAAQNKIGEAEKRLLEKGHTEFIAPLKAFLEIDIKNALRERRTLNIRRIDLDAAKAKVKRTTSAERIQAAEAELRMIQHSFDEQVEVTRSVLKKIVETQTTHNGYIQALIAAQREFFSECVSQLNEISSSAPPPSVQIPATSFLTSNTFEVNGIQLDRDETRKGKVLYDYEAENDGELSVTGDQDVMATPIPGDTDYLMIEVDGKFGKVPGTYIQLL